MNLRLSMIPLVVLLPTHSTGKYIARGPVSDLCYAPLDVVHVNEATSLFDPLWPILAKQATKVLGYMKDVNPKSRFGFGSYADKPVAPMGYPQDWCFKQELSLERREPEEVADLYTTYAESLQGGGGDWPQNSLGGVFRAIFSPSMGWQDLKDGRFMASQPKTGNHTRVLLLVVGSTPHEAGDYETLTDVNAECGSIDYPELTKIGDYLAARNIVTVVLARPGGTMRPDGSFSPAKSLALKGKQYRTPEGLALWYKDVLSARGVKVFANLLEDRMSSFFPTFEAAMDRFMEWRCEASPETTEVPAASELPTESVLETAPSPTDEGDLTEEAPCRCPCPEGCCCPSKVFVQVEVVRSGNGKSAETARKPQNNDDSIVSTDLLTDPTMEP